MNKVRTRIAPSPTGSPHIGTAYAALFNYCFAKKNNGDFVLRIEDTDRTRFVEGSEKEIIESLSWLGLNPDESPFEGGKFGPYRQSERLEIYKEHAQKLIDSGKAYFCNCTSERLEKLREDQQSRKELPHYDRKCRFDPPKNTENTVIRLSVPDEGTTIVADQIRGEVEFQNSGIDDQVLIKSDGFPTYHLASVVDDHLMEISHVIRAEEWLSSTPKHVLLYQAFGWEVPVFVHLALLRNPDRSKISKRKNPVSLTFYKDQGYLPEALVNFLGLMGWSMPDDQEIFSLSEMISAFSFDRLDVAGPVFDIQKLDWLNGEYIRKIPDDKLARRIVEGKFTKYTKEQVQQKLYLVKERMKRLTDFDPQTKYFFEPVSVEPSFISSASGLNYEGTVSWLKSTQEIFAGTAPTNWKSKTLEESLEKKREELGANKTKYFQTIRASVSGSIATPPLGQTLEAIGKDKTESQIEEAIKNLEKTTNSNSDKN